MLLSAAASFVYDKQPGSCYCLILGVRGHLRLFKNFLPSSEPLKLRPPYILPQPRKGRHGSERRTNRVLKWTSHRVELDKRASGPGWECAYSPCAHFPGPALQKFLFSASSTPYLISSGGKKRSRLCYWPAWWRRRLVLPCGDTGQAARLCYGRSVAGLSPGWR